MDRKKEYNRSRKVQTVLQQKLAILVLMALVLGLATPVSVLAQGRTQVYLLPPSDALTTGQPVTIDIIADGVSNLYGAEIHVRFDPTLLRLEDADPQQDGVQLAPGTLLDPGQGFVVANQSDNQAGTAVFAITLVNPAQPVEGSGVIAQLTMVPLQPGPLRVELESAKLVTRDLQSLDVSLSSLEVQATGQSIMPTGADQAASEVAVSAPLTGPSQSPSVPIWMLVLVALAVVCIPLAGAWFLFIQESKRRPRPNNSH